MLGCRQLQLQLAGVLEVVHGDSAAATLPTAHSRGKK